MQQQFGQQSKIFCFFLSFRCYCYFCFCLIHFILQLNLKCVLDMMCRLRLLFRYKMIYYQSIIQLKYIKVYIYIYEKPKINALKNLFRFNKIFDSTIKINKLYRKRMRMRKIKMKMKELNATIFSSFCLSFFFLFLSFRIDSVCIRMATVDYTRCVTNFL